MQRRNAINEMPPRPRFRWVLLATVVVSVLTGALIGFAARDAFDKHRPSNPPDVHTFVEVIAQIRDNYVEPRTESELLDDGIRGLMSGLDEHSTFLDERALIQLTEQTTGHFGGIGVELTQDEGVFRIIAPIDDSPAQRAGINAGDELLRIDEVPVVGQTLDQVTEALRGAPGTPVTLEVHRKSTDVSLDFAMIRTAINVDSVRGRLLEPGYGYVRISQFQTETGPELIKTIATLQAEQGPLQGMVLDLRNNPGGVLQASVDVADVFLTDDAGLIVSTQGRQRSSDLHYLATGNDLLDGAPLVVLINKGSASAAEIVAGSLQDHRRAMLLGSTSYGKGSVQAVLPLEHHRALKLTTALYFTPSGRSIQAKGIHPDIEMIADNPTDDESTALLAEAVRQLKDARRG